MSATPVSEPVVQIKLSEVQRIRDRISKLPERHTSNQVRQLHRQLMELYQTLQKQVQKQ